MLSAVIVDQDAFPGTALRGVDRQISALGYVFTRDQEPAFSRPLLDPRRFAREFSSHGAAAEGFASIAADVSVATSGVVSARAARDSRFFTDATRPVGILPGAAPTSGTASNYSEVAHAFEGATANTLLSGTFARPDSALLTDATALFREISTGALDGFGGLSRIANEIEPIGLPNPVPEPTTAILLSAGGIVLFLGRRRLLQRR